MSMRAKLAAAFAVLGAGVAPAAAAPAIIAGEEGNHFDGLYVAADVGRQDMVGGALIDGVDVLAERRRLAATVSAGYRKQFGGFVIGVEGGYGYADGDLHVVDPAEQLEIDARNSSQFFYGAQAGVLGGADKDMLFFAYASEVKRSYDIDIVSMGSAFSQTDKQGMLRFGGGVEKVISGPLHVRLTVGSARGKYSAAAEQPKRHLEFSAGVVLQF
ncbi:MAG: hypothetical protein R3C58_11035 [Parvularculaceae bacterium]